MAGCSSVTQTRTARREKPPTPAAVAQIAHADLRREWGAPSQRSPFPSALVSKHTPSVRRSPIWSRKNSPTWSMCLEPPRYYNLMNRQAGCPLNIPLPEPQGRSLRTCASPPRGLYAGVAEEQRRREKAERERDELRRALYALREPRESPETVGEEPERAPARRLTRSEGRGGAQWRRVFGG